MEKKVNTASYSPERNSGGILVGQLQATIEIQFAQMFTSK